MHCQKRICSVIVLTLIFAWLSCQRVSAEGPRTAYISTGDNQWELWLPMDSKAGIDSAFDTLKKDFNVNRILWRGGQSELWMNAALFRPENAYCWYFWKEWVFPLITKDDNNKCAIQAARRNGMQIWVNYGLLEFGCQADYGGMWPAQYQLNATIEHPEWMPVNRYGTRKQGGPIEFCYPQAREYYVKLLTDFLVEQGYDGFSFYTYAEDWGIRYLDEFGYNQPIVDEFKKRYGVDIRKDDFDKEAWGKLRGEYLTQFLRELRSSLSKHNKKIAMWVDPYDTHLPQLWPWSDTGPGSTYEPERTQGGTMRPGRIFIDWETWAKEGIVDELTIATRPDNKRIYSAAKEVYQGVQGTACVVSAMLSNEPLPDGVERILMLHPGTNVESGFKYENYVRSGYEKIDPQDKDSAWRDDAYAKRRLLYTIETGKEDMPVSDLAHLVFDKDLFVRRMALRALAAKGDILAIPLLEAALRDTEHSVRCQAVMSLSKLKGPGSVKKIFEALDRNYSFQFGFEAMRTAFKAMASQDKLTDADLQEITRALQNPNVNTRRIAACVSGAIDCSKYTSIKAPLLQAFDKEQDSFAGELLIDALCKTIKDKTVEERLFKALQDSDNITQVRTAQYAAPLIASGEDQPTKDKWLDRLSALFSDYGEKSVRKDKDWGWRLVGEAMLRFVQPGQDRLEKLMNQKNDRKLANLAWQALYIPQHDDNYYPATEDNDRKAHDKHPYLKF